MMLWFLFQLHSFLRLFHIPAIVPKYWIICDIFFAYRLSIALLHSDDNELYLPFWKIVSFRWSDNTLKKMILGFCSFSGDKLKLVVEHQMRSGKEEEL
jgi:hypothetical protein